MRKIIPIILLPIIFLSCSVPACYGEDYTRLRQKMVASDIKDRGIKAPSVLKAMGKIPRHLFVSDEYKKHAYGDFPLPIGEGQTISQPYVVALMTEAIKLRSTDKVLEIGTGSGYQSAVLAEIAKEVYTIEIRNALAKSAEKLLRRLGYKNITGKVGDGYYGWEEKGPFDAIVITASANHIPPPLIKQLKPGGRLIIPLGPTTFSQTLTLATKKGDGKIQVTLFGGVRFVPMTGKVRGD